MGRISQAGNIRAVNMDGSQAKPASPADAALKRHLDTFHDWTSHSTRAEPRLAYNYPHWDAVVDAAVDALDGPLWTHDSVERLLTVLNEDYVTERFRTSLARHPTALHRLATFALRDGHPMYGLERGARRQLVAALELRHDPDTEPLLLQFAHHPDEYVSVPALVALARVGSTALVPLARRHWAAGGRDGQFAALLAFRSAGSHLFAPLAQRFAARHGHDVVYAVDRALGR